MSDPTTPLLETPLTALHRRLGGRIVPFAGYAMPVQFPDGVIAEHNHTRSAAGLFDVSHMGQAEVRGAGATAALEALMPGDLAALAPGRIRYSQLLTDQAGILDDLMVTAIGPDQFYLVVNASRKEFDLAHIESGLGAGCRLTRLESLALVALQGPLAGDCLTRLLPGVAEQAFMSMAEREWEGRTLRVSRSGYTGEDGFEISVPETIAEGFAQRLLEMAEIAPIGLGARDSLRLEAGLCLYGNDIDETTTPIEAGLTWSISKRRRAEGGFPGAAIVQAQLRDGPPRHRVGIKPDGKAPLRQGAEIRLSGGDAAIGTVTSGSFGASAGGPVAMGYVAAGCEAPGTGLDVSVRGRAMPATITRLPFVPHRYARTAPKKG